MESGSCAKGEALISSLPARHRSLIASVRNRPQEEEDADQEPEEADEDEERHRILSLDSDSMGWPLEERCVVGHSLAPTGIYGHYVEPDAAVLVRVVDGEEGGLFDYSTLLG
jgi:hypothetical protein